MTRSHDNQNSVRDRDRLGSIAQALPRPLKTAVKWVMKQPSRCKRSLKVAMAKHRIEAAGRTGDAVRLLGFDVHINHGPTPCELYEDIFVNGVYDFVANRPDPRILDCGSNIGMSALYFKHLYPQAHIVGFEPDPSIFDFLRENVEDNSLQDVEIVNAALAAQEGTITLSSDGGAASHIEGYRPGGSATEWTPFDVRCVKLSDYLDEPVDYMKMNIEGAEYEVLSECESRIGQIEQMNIEYHRLPGVPCTLHEILDLLHRNGFTYVVSDFGMVMYGSARPPARVDPQALYWRQIYARQHTRDSPNAGARPLLAGRVVGALPADRS